LELLKESNHVKRFRALRLCKIHKQSYEKNEIKSIRKLGRFLHDEIDTNVKTKEVSKLIGSENVYECPHCLKKTKEGKICECRRNKFGLKEQGGDTPKKIGINLLETSNALKAAFDQL
jgi:hypothetical protein